MPPKRNDMLRHLARLGAEQRLLLIQNEETAIYREFPELRGFVPKATRTARTGDGPGTAGKVRRRKRPKMTAAQRKAVGLRMKKYWAARKAAAAAKKR